jgi:LysM repeat protein
MMKKLVLIVFLLSALTIQAQREKAEAYINAYKELAIAEMIRTGVPAAIKLAQGILESQAGESDLAKTSNNHFGIKCKTEWTGARTYHDDDEKGECFRVYQSVEESYRDHSDFLKNRPYYAALFKLNPADYEAWAKGLKQAGYATSPSYPQQLLKVINDYNLQQYSLDALNRLQKNTGSNSSQNMTNSGSTMPVVNPIPTRLPQLTKNSSFPEGIFIINHSRVIYAAKGSSLQILAKQYDITLSKLLDYNELNEPVTLDGDCLIYLEKKLKKGLNEYHIVSNGETLYDVCQLEGVRLESLLEYNNRQKTDQLATGEKIYLHPQNTISTFPGRASQ